MDGDVEMRHRSERGGKRYRQRKAKAMGVDDVEMQEVEVCLKLCVQWMLHAPYIFLKMQLCFHLWLHCILRLVMVYLHLLIVLFGVYFWIPSSTALGRFARTDCTTCACKAWPISKLDIITVHHEPRRYCCHDTAVFIMIYAGI